jgi:hypothetical protein
MRLIALVTLACALSAFAQSAEKPKYALPTDGFPISYWAGPPKEFTTIERYKEIKDAGFTFVMPPVGATTVELNKQILDLCGQVGLKAFIQDPRMPLAVNTDPAMMKRIDDIVADYSKHPAFLGYFMCDEPAGGAFSGLADVVARLKDKDPAHPAYINLLPDYADHTQLEAPSYERYIRNFIADVHPAFVSYDHYHFTVNGDRRSFLQNLTSVREVTIDLNMPFFQIVLLTQHGTYRNLTEGEIRYEATHTLAYGGRGLLWFTYWSPAKFDANYKWEHAMINADGSKDPHYDMVKKVNEETRALGEQLAGAQSTGIVKATQATPITVGLFNAADGTKMALIVTEDYKKPVPVPATIPAPADKLRQFDLASKKWVSIDAKPVGNKSDLTFTFSPGGGVLLKW